uniref:Rrn7/TAF1B C-terminal cyclin domain-containing protein n=1 Tax=Megaselia scalaris TaxID=36166 RepID=T1GIN7_MEGSC
DYSEEFVEDLTVLDKKKARKEKKDKFNITSWEVFNYILRGLVEELLELGAKEELKEKVLQIWSALLRSQEIAFFNTQHSELPKLNLKFCQNDVSVLYNHKVNEKKRHRKRGPLTAKRELSKQKKLLELSEYEVLSKSDASMSTLSNTMSLNSSVTGGISNKAVRLSFQPYAKKHFKQAIGSKHLKKHEVDGENKLTCHRLAKIGPLTTEQLSHEIRRTSLYSIIYIALNLIEDNIQLSDMRRYMLEGRISTLNVDKFFPENIRENCRKILRETFFSHGSQPNRIQDSRIRQHSPEMRWTAIIPPLYEARAMAYIIFVIKLLFGLDDSMESEISEASRKINESVPEANLFIFDDWMRYLEMRKIILAQASIIVMSKVKQILEKINWIIWKEL